MTTTIDHTAIRQRTIPARILRSLSIWRLCAWLNLEDVDWSLLCRLAVVFVSFVLAAHGHAGWALWVLLAAMVVRK